MTTLHLDVSMPYTLFSIFLFYTMYPLCLSATMCLPPPWHVWHSYCSFPCNVIFFDGLDWDFYLFCTTCHTDRTQKCNPSLDTMYPYVNFREGECYAQLCSHWIPRNPSLWIPVSPDSLYYTDIRFAAWTYPSFSFLLHDLMHVPCYSMLFNMLLSITPTFS